MSDLNVDIKERTAMIKNRVIPDSHKKTKNMIIPLEWEEKPIKDICKINKKSLGTSTEDAYQFRYYDLSAIDNGKVYHPFEKITFETAPSRARRVFQKYDILLSTVRPNLKGFAYIDFDVNDCIASTGFAVLESHDQNDAQYIYQNLYSCGIEKQINRLLVGSNYPAINNDQVENLRIPYPENRYERKKIGDILSTWDKAIELKEKLIEEKKKQKSGLMQKLLTGKVRLPGFDGEWEYKKANLIFANISDKKHGGIGEVLSATQDNGILPRSEIGIDIKFEESSLSSYKRILKGDFVISLRSFQGGIEYSEYSGLVSPAYTVLRNKLDISHAFYKKFFKSTDFITRLNGLIYGIRDGKQIGYKDFSVLELPYPDSKEQEAIGEIIELADKEIKLHEKELEALKQQKKGLMQLLLTGIVRVNVETN